MCGGHGDRLGSHSQGAHHAGRTEGHMRGADNAAREEEIGDIAAVERAVGNAIHATGLPMRAAGQGAVNPLRGMQIQSPTTVRHAVGVFPLLDDILLGHHHIAFKTTTFTLARHMPDPFKRQIFRLRKLARVLDVIPNSINHLPQFPLDLLRVMHGVERATVFDPPKIASVLFRVEGFVAWNFCDVIQREGWRNITDRATGVFRVEIDRVTEEFTKGGIGTKLFPELLPALGTHAECGSGHESQDPVARGIAEQRSSDVVKRRVLTAKGAHRLDGIGIFLGDIEHGRIEEQSDVGLVPDRFQQNGVEEERVAFWIAVEVFQQQLVEHPALAGPAVVVIHVRSGPQNPEPHLARGVTAQDRAILCQHYLQSLPRGGDGRTSACDASADDPKVGGQRDCFQTTGQGG